MKILFIGDIVGEPGRELVARKLPELKDREKPDFIVANAENAAGGKGITTQVMNELLSFGIDVLTLGNHTFDRKETDRVFENPAVLRPVNYPANVPGRGYGIYEAGNGENVAVVNAMGRVYMPHIDCPFVKMNEILPEISKTAKNILVDFHAEITSEKIAFGWYMDGRVSAVVGTHTHVPTADEKVLPSGTAFITDAGMTGPAEGVIGMDRELVLKKFLTGIPQHFSVAKGASVMQGCVITLNSSGRADEIRRFEERGR
ncbi:MAG: TIGR00282 family metallophosphoesterase [Endomicrobiales bacterium]|nr:TIGR00282 family metallophosphoesterase [Endomicrobiales bacterium]